jgi:hypothetical protein
VLVWETAKKGDVGHVAIRVDGATFGYYPTDTDGDGEYSKEDLKGSPGDMHIDDSKEFSETYRGDEVTEYELHTTVEQKGLLLGYLNEFVRDPGMYSLTGLNCTSVAIMCLQKAKVDIWIPIYGNFPSGLSKVLSADKSKPIVKNKTTFTVQ